ncbi:DUF4197 domain-containing protein [Arenimonas oryziterrae]|uniref:DUF4197 domain-containing protein n=1 Tax=Arenimonas oryziterrae DSM 21050 = YC6267 TaxID=1121015 RepID=A0A091AQ11_9GAMM|nr:DUF4197 domain-containing protein [Arenimonas oryziterrae]KFN42263.1 hypothetical protein N789_14360 [Arenimonas oryziterrae DSM 21050 = YC6267]
MRLAPVALAATVVLLLGTATASADSWKDKLRQAVAQPGTANGVSQNEAAGGIKEALAQGVKRAITQLGRRDGFQGDPLVRILVPEKIRGLTDTARRLGAGRKVDEFELSMNRAAEQAIPVAADIFSDAVRQMTVQDALNIVRGADDAGTQYFRRVTENSLRAKFQPIVARATAQTGVTQRYKSIVGKNQNVTQLLGGGQSLDLDSYVTTKAMDGLYFYVAQQEKEIRRDPLKRTTALLKKVFG